MSRKTLRSSNFLVIAPTAKRLALCKLHVACATCLFALAPSISAGLELGNATIKSRLGEPLVVEIPYRLADGERLTPDCVGLVAAPRSARVLPSYARASRVAITPTHIRIAGDSRVLEPLIGVTVGVQCASTPNFTRSYEFFVDPPSYLPASGTAVVRAETPVPVPVPVPVPAVPVPPATRAADTVGVPTAEAPRAPRAAASTRARGQTGGTLMQGQTYVVVRGDTLTGIAARVGDRPGTIRATADAIYAANAEAFARGDQDLLQAGRAITIPLLAAATTDVAATPAPVAAPAVADPALRAAAQPIVTELPPAAASDALAPPVNLAAAVVPRSVEPLAAAAPLESPAPLASPAPQASEAPLESAAPLAQPSAALAPSAVDPTPAAASGSGAGGLGALWMALLSALAGALASAVVVLWLVRRRQQEAPPPEAAQPRTTHRRKFVDPTAGIDVVEGELPRARAAVSAQSAPLTAPLDVRAALVPDFDLGSPQSGATGSVDLDVGMPTPSDAVIDEGARTATLRQQTVEAPTAVLEANVDDERHTLTVAELDILRADYEAEHTLTQESSKALRDALVDLKAMEAEHAASIETARMEMPDAPQAPHSASIETQPTRKLRAHR